ncbi:hypothetical protein [Micromonospora sp. C95]|uniref:hypothetical protein n=1 Tax=Micromonospora sp. C95 TaxID=2824882 RepID=UPI001B37BAB8|nr:hypothetical protein [Micromonospora sp. C95]MBQ1026480.1 hypothetical protein [Micromonospora sp. C95]
MESVAMREIGDEFFVTMAEVAGTLIGTFLIGIFFYLDSDLHKTRRGAAAADRYLRSGVRWVFLVLAVPLIVSLTFAGLEPIWGALTFIALSVLLVAATADTTHRILARGSSAISTAFVVNEVTSTAAVVVLVALPWVLGGWVPPPSAFVPSLLLALGSGFFSTVALVMTLFGPARQDDTPT